MTQRDLTAAMLTAIAAGTVRPAILYEGAFSDGGSPEGTQYLRLWTGVGPLSWNTYTWTGGGELLGISAIGESADVAAVGFSATLSGFPSGLITLAESLGRQGYSGKLWLACFDSAGALIADPYLLRRGMFDITVIERSGETCTISAQYEDRLVDLERPRARYYTSEDQQIDYPGDLGFDYVPSLQDMDILWS